MPYEKIPTYLTAEQRYALTQILADLSNREIARYYTFSPKDLDLINQRRRPHNRIGSLCRQLSHLEYIADLTSLPPVRQEVLQGQ